MAKKIKSPPTCWQPGQRFVCNMGKYTGWAPLHGEVGFVVSGPEYRESWLVGSIDGSRPSEEDGGGWRYKVIVTGRSETNYFCVEHMRPLGGKELSTWAKFKRATGLDIRKAPANANAKRQRTTKAEKMWEDFRANGCRSADFLAMPVDVMANPPDWFFGKPTTNLADLKAARREHGVSPKGAANG